MIPEVGSRWVDRDGDAATVIVVTDRTLVAEYDEVKFGARTFLRGTGIRATEGFAGWESDGWTREVVRPEVVTALYLVKGNGMLTPHYPRNPDRLLDEMWEQVDDENHLDGAWYYVGVARVFPGGTWVLVDRDGNAVTP